MTGSDEQNRPGWGISLHWVTVISLLYLALPCMLFFSSWFTPWVAWPVNLSILLSICFYARSPQAISPVWSMKKGDITGMLCTFIVAVLSFCYAGVAGYVSPHPDILIFREALYQNLIAAPWPVVLPDGREMSYYLAGMLPPALLSRLIDDYTIQRLVSVFWYALGIWLTIFLFCCKHCRFSALFVLFLTFFKDPAYLILNSLSGTGDIWSLLSRWLPLPANTYEGGRMAFYNLMNSGQTGNFSPFTTLATAILLTNARNGHSLAPLLVTLLLPTSPLASIGLMPLALVIWFKNGGLQSIRNLAALWTPLLIFGLSAFYYLRAESDTCIGLYGELMNNWKYFLENYYSTTLLGGFLLFILLFSRLKTDSLLCISLLCSMITPWIYFGSTPESGIFGNNELWLKTCMIYQTHIIAAISFNWRNLNILKYLYLASLILLTLYNIFQNRIPWTHSPVVSDTWNGHLHHQHPFIYQKVPTCREPWIPGLLLHGGEAEQCFPGNLLPKAPGCDYSRPARPDGVHITY